MKKNKKQYIAPKMKWGEMDVDTTLLAVSEGLEVKEGPVYNDELEEDGF